MTGGLFRRPAMTTATPQVTIEEKQGTARATAPDLVDVAAALANAETPSQISEVIVARVAPALGAFHAFVGLVEESSNDLRIIADEGFRRDTIEAYRRLSLDRPLPACESIRTATPIWLESREVAFAAYPEMAPPANVHGTHAWAMLPLRTSNKVFGVFGLAFTRPRTFSSEDRAAMETVSHACAQAFERAHLVAEIRAERDGRENVLRSLNDGIITMDTRGRLGYANPAAADLLGFASPEEVLRTPPHELYAKFDVLDEAGHPLPLDALPAFKALQGEEPPETIVRWRLKGTQRERWSSCRYRPMRAADGSVVGVVTVFREITPLREAQSQAQELGERYRALVETAWDGIVSSDGEGRIAYVNPAAERMFGYSSDELRGRPFTALLPERVQERAAFERALRAAGSPVTGHALPLTGLTNDGREFPMDATLAAGRGEGPSQFTVILRDVTERKRAEGALRTQVDRLQILNELTLTVGRAERIEDVYRAALSGLQGAVQADRASILLFDGDGVIRFKAWTRLSAEYRAAVEGHSPWPRDAKDPRPIIVSDVYESADWSAYRPVFEREGIRALAFLPLVQQGVLLGKCMVYYDEPHVFTEEEVQTALAVAGHVSFAIDRKQNRAALRDADENLRIVMDASPVFITYVDADGRFQYVNRRFAQLLGRTRDEILGRRVPEVMGPDLYATVAPHLASAFEGQPSAFDLTLDVADGVRHLSAQYEPNRGPDGELRGVLGVIADITERKQHEEELRTANERLQELDRLKTHFLNAVSHEMRTPLTPIQLQLDVLGAATTSPEGRRRAVEILDRNVRRLTRLVQEMVDVSKLQAGRFLVERAPVDLHRVVLEAFESYQEPARRAGVDLRLRSHGPLPVEADAQRLAQVLSNLLSNALKFTPAARSIELSTDARRGELIVCVRDEGVGLTEEQIGRLFQPFTQVHNAGEASRSGTGLGLYLSKGMVEAHGGRMWVESDGPDKGAAFSFVLPQNGKP